ncbi:MAG: hypothetical protein OEV42_19115 [Deltaproteobacteria bacterium]|nr:hypothetical protein [Deltaproteobacteria bacterium]
MKKKYSINRKGEAMKKMNYSKERLLTRLTSTVVLTVFLLMGSSVNADIDNDKPILIIGASYENGVTPIDDNLFGPFYGAAVNYGSYLSLGDALVRNDQLNGFVINEARGGASVYYREYCGPDSCGFGSWQGYDVQFQKALSRVVIRDPQNPMNILGYNADYLIMGTPTNDCLHAGGVEEPQLVSDQCTTEELNHVIDGYINIAQQAVAIGITPIVAIYPDYNDINWQVFQTAFALPWVINESTYNELKGLFHSRLQVEVPEVLLVEAWDQFKPIGDGLHPDFDSSTNAAKKIVKAMKEHIK